MPPNIPQEPYNRAEATPPFFKGRNLLIATMHKKETVIAPVLEKMLGVKCITAEKINTDLLGTFTGEVARKADPLHTAIDKCEMAMQAYQMDLCVANEGSFGPHPYLHFIPAADEIMVLVDKKNNLLIKARKLSTHTNFNGCEINSEQELVNFSRVAKFPEHALILRIGEKPQEHIIKGITDPAQLLDLFRLYKREDKKVLIETDMRAMYNPTRMKVIKELAMQLALNAGRGCPACGIPGFCITDKRTGLPCSLCGSPTASVMSDVYTCEKCGFSKEAMFPSGKKMEDPMYCQYCNP